MQEIFKIHVYLLILDGIKPWDRCDFLRSCLKNLEWKMESMTIHKKKERKVGKFQGDNFPSPS